MANRGTGRRKSARKDRPHRTVYRPRTRKRQVEQALHGSEECFRVLTEAASEGIAIHENGRIVEANHQLAQIFGYSRVELIGMSVVELAAPESRDLVAYHIETNHEQLYEALGLRKDGSTFVAELRGKSIPYRGRSLRVTTILDITERKQQALEILQQSQERYRAFLKHLGEGIWHTELEVAMPVHLTEEEQIDHIYKHSYVAECNDEMARMLGYSCSEEVIGIRVKNLHAREPDHIELQRAFIRGGYRLYNAESHEVDRFGNRKYFLNNSIGSVVDGFLVGTWGTQRDITERKKAEEQIAYQAYHDALTDLPNRNLFYDRLNQALRHAQRHKAGLAVLFLDLDHFKLINDTLGHSVGDWLLKQVAQRLRDTVRHLDTVARVGGDEFILLLLEISRSEDVARVAQKIQDVISKPLRFDNHDLFITTSIGISMSPSDGLDAETLVKSADSALYRAKELGRNNYQLWSPSLNVRVHERLSLERSIRHAIEREEFLLHYQPQFCLRTGGISGVEALIRWQHPERGLTYPKDFISLAEETRLILPIGEWLLRTACRQVKLWQQEGLRNIRLSTNLSGCELQHQNLITLVEEVLRETGLNPPSLVFEITETAAMQNVDLTLAVLHTLKKKGVLIALDDFGTGYSSLSYLKYFPIDIIKIDPSFVRDAGSGKEEEALVRSVIQLGRSMKRRVIAEGVETETQRAFLQLEGCEEMQGFLLSPPLPPEEVERVLIRDMAR